MSADPDQDPPLSTARVAAWVFMLAVAIVVIGLVIVYFRAD